MSCTVIYYHRLQFPSESGQTIQVLRDYHALACLGHTVHLIYRSVRPLTEAEETAALRGYGLDPLPTFHLHPLVEGRQGKKRLHEAVRQIIQTGCAPPLFLLTRTLDHARSALALRAQMGSAVPKVIMELHETAIPHMIYREQGRWLRALASCFLERRVFRALDGIICTVGSQLALLDSLYPRHAPGAVLPNGVSVRLLDRPLPYRASDGKMVRLGYAGQLNAWKNVNIMIESLKFLPPHVVLDVAGGKAEMERHTRDSLVEYAETTGVGGRVNYVGFLPPDEVPEFLSGMNILLLPLGNNAQSRYFTSPMKLFEYAASGVPMVVTRQPTTLSLIQDGVHALMTDPGSAQSMASAVSDLLVEPERARTLAANAREWVTQYTYDKRAERLAGFLYSVAQT